MENNVLTANHAELKWKILNACIKAHRALMENLTESIKHTLTKQGLNNDDIRKVSTMATELESMRRERKLLYNMIPTIKRIHSAVQPGSVAITTKNIIFFSAGLGQIDVDGVKILCLSINSQLYLAMEGMKSKYVFSINNDTYTIQEVF